MDNSQILMILFIIIGIVALVFVFAILRIFRLWLSAQLSGVRVSLLQLIIMPWRRVNPTIIVENMVTANKAGISVTRDQLEAHFLAGGNVKRVIAALVSADKANIPLDFKACTAIDLAGRCIGSSADECES